jgi:hypothetical protein
MAHRKKLQIVGEVARGGEHGAGAARKALLPFGQGLRQGLRASRLADLSKDGGNVGEEVAAASEQVSQFGIADVCYVVTAVPCEPVARGLEYSGAFPLAQCRGRYVKPAGQLADRPGGSILEVTVVGRPGEHADGRRDGVQRCPVTQLASMALIDGVNAESMFPSLTARITARLAG